MICSYIIDLAFMFEKMLFYYLLVKNKYMTISPCSGILQSVSILYFWKMWVWLTNSLFKTFTPPPFKKNHINTYLNYNSKFLSLCTVICLGIPLIVKFLWILIYIKYEEDTASLGWYDNYTLSNLLGWRSRFKSWLNTIPIK